MRIQASPRILQSTPLSLAAPDGAAMRDLFRFLLSPALYTTSRSKS